MANIIQQFKNAGGDNIYPVAYAQGGMKMDLLWTNPSPTSAFAPQTVNIDLSEYSMVYVTSSWTATDTNTWFGLLIKVGNSGIFSAIGTSKIYRGFHVSTSGINFEKGQYATSGGSSMTDNNLYAVPRQIYGIKMSYIVPTNVHGIQYVEV